MKVQPKRDHEDIPGGQIPAEQNRGGSSIGLKHGLPCLPYTPRPTISPIELQVTTAGANGFAGVRKKSYG